MRNSFILTGENLTFVVNGKTYTLSKTKKIYAEARQLIIDGDYDAAVDLYNSQEEVKKTIEKRIGKSLKLNGNTFSLDDEELPYDLLEKIKEYTAKKMPYDALMNFWNKLKQNPSKDSQKDLFGFLKANRISICENGNFIAYKRVRETFLDVHSGTLDNTPGKVVEMPRERVDQNRQNTCSSGLHVAGWSYLSSFSGDRVVEISVDPRDVVAVPPDYNQAKMRVCKYFVIREITDMVNNPSAEEILYDPIYRDKGDTKETIKKEKPVKESKNRFKAKLTGEDRLPVSGQMTIGLGIKPGGYIGVDVVDNMIVLTKNYKKAEWNYRTNPDGRIKVSKSILEKIGKLVSTYYILTSKDKIIISKK